MRAERMFLGWDAPLLPRAAELLSQTYAAEGAARMDGVLVVVPGARAGRRLGELLAAEADRSGRRLVPPRIVEPGRIPESMARPLGRRPTPLLAALAWGEALGSLRHDRFALLFARRPEETDLREWALLGRELARVHETVTSAGLRFADVERRCGDLPGYRDVARWGVLREVQDEYERRLARAGMTDPQLARLERLGEGAPEFSGDIWLVGVSELLQITRRFIERSDARVRALVQAPTAREDWFDDLGCVIPERWADVEVPIPDASLRVARRPSEQSAAVVRFLSELDPPPAPEEIVVGVPDAEVVPHLRHHLLGAGVATRPATGTPISDSGPYRLLSALAGYMESHRFEALATLARHPHLDAWLGSSLAEWDGSPGAHPVPIDALDRYATRSLPATIAAAVNPSGGGSDAGSDAALTHRIAAAVEGLVSGMKGERSLSQWMGEVRTLLATVYTAESSAGDRGLSPETDRGLSPETDRALSPETERALELLARAAVSAESAPPEFDPGCTAPVAIRILLEEVGTENVPAPDDIAAVELLGWLELHLEDAPVIALTGMNEGRLPAGVSSDPFLPDRLRASLGLEDDKRRYARDAYRLRALIGTGAKLLFVAGRQTEAGDPLRPSRLLFADTAEVAARRILGFYREAPRAVRGEAAAWMTSPSTGFALPPEPTLALPPSIDRLRVTDFARFEADPYGFALERFHGLEPQDDDARELDPRNFGSLAHSVLQSFGGHPAARSTDPRQVFAVLERFLEARAAGTLARHPRVAATMQVDLLRVRLRAFAEWQARWVADGWRIVEVEAAPAGGATPLEVDDEPVWISARVDRVDYHADSRTWAVFDYKTSEAAKSPSETHGPDREGRWRDFQLPLYHWLAPSLLGPDGSPVLTGPGPLDIRVGYIRLPGDLAQTGESFAEWSAAELNLAVEAAREIVRRLRHEAIAFDPSYRPRFTDRRMDALLGRGVLTAGSGPDESWEEDDS